MKLAAAINRGRISAAKQRAHARTLSIAHTTQKFTKGAASKAEQSDFSLGAQRERFLIFRVRAPLIRAPALGNQEEYKCEASAPEMPKAMQRERVRAPYTQSTHQPGNFKVVRDQNFPNYNNKMVCR